MVNNETFDLVGNTEFRVDMAAAPGTAHTTHSPTVSGRLGVLDNDSDPVENDPIAVTASPAASTPIARALRLHAAARRRLHIEATGEFSFTPAPGATSGSFTYTVTDQPSVGTPANVPGTVTFNFLDMIWYVDGDAGGGGNGTSIAPFNNFSSLSGAGGVGDSDIARTTTSTSARQP